MKEITKMHNKKPEVQTCDNSQPTTVIVNQMNELSLEQSTNKNNKVENGSSTLKKNIETSNNDNKLASNNDDAQNGNNKPENGNDNSNMIVSQCDDVVEDANDEQNQPNKSKTKVSFSS